MKELFDLLLALVEESENKTSIDRVTAVARSAASIVELAKQCPQLADEDVKAEISAYVSDYVRENRDCLSVELGEWVDDEIAEAIAVSAGKVASL